ncbi:MAG: aldehyde dehydrogenase family protein [Gammaproteobacteria bacterium]|nr:aldehyde dehydrogenase family protein [Gammaproteobacteria bacterium]
MVPEASGYDGVVEVRAPFDGEIIATLDAADTDVVENALATAHRLFRDRSRWLSKHARIEILSRAAEIMQQQAPVLARLAAQEGGKPLADSRVEVARAIDGVRSCVECLRTHAGREIPMGLSADSAGRRAFTHHEPIGPVVAISAFNHPLNLIVHQVAPAIAAGNPVIVKPAEDTPLSCYRFVQILQEAGLPQGWCQALVVRDVNLATQLVTDPRVAFLSFIGSSKVGWMLRSKLSAGTRCALEHGGAAPVVVDSDADIDDAIPLLTKGGFYHAGQVCVSVQRIFCHEDIADDVAARLAYVAEHLHVGDPLFETTDVGPLIRPREVNRVHDWVLEARRAGAQVLTGGNTLADSCYSPTVLFNPPDHTSVSRREIFGPVVCVYACSDMEDAIRRANSLPYAFQASVFTRNLDFALDASAKLAASAVMVNDHTAFRTDWMPFAGLRESGLGTGGIPYTFRDMQVEKMTVLRSSGL